MDGPGTRLLCIIVPCFDEEQVIEATHAELKRVLDALPRFRHLIYFVDDGSRDATFPRLQAIARRDEATRVLALSRNFGHQIAITAGLDYADRRADAVLVMDADLENPPALIPQMLEQFELGHDVVMGVRETSRVVGWWRRSLSRGFYALFNRLSQVAITPGAPDFFLLSRRAREALAKMGDQRRFMRAMVAWIGFSRANVSYVPPARLAGRSKYNLARMLSLAGDALFAFSWAPLLWVGLVGAVLCSVGSALLLASAWNAQLGYLPGLLTLLAGLQLGALGVVGGYVGRIFQHSQSRPLYVVRDAPDEGASEPRILEVGQRAPRRASGQ